MSSSIPRVESDGQLSRAPSEIDLSALPTSTSRKASDGLMLATDDRWIASLDLNGFAAELKSLGKTLADNQGAADVEHLHKIVRWSRTCTAVGLVTSAVCPNPIAVTALALGCMTRWTIVAHHVCHGGFDRVDTGGRYNRFKFGVGSLYRRCVDWLDWMLVEAWNVEHNQLHHYFLGEDKDPDLLERNLSLIRDLPAWMLPLKYAAVTFMIFTWKWYYYSPNTFKMLKLNQARRTGKPIPHTEAEQEAPCVVFSWLTPWYAKYFTNLEFFGKVLGPFFLVRFILLPLLMGAVRLGCPRGRVGRVRC